MPSRMCEAAEGHESHAFPCSYSFLLYVAMAPMTFRLENLGFPKITIMLFRLPLLTRIKNGDHLGETVATLSGVYWQASGSGDSHYATLHVYSALSNTSNRNEFVNISAPGGT